MKNQSSRPRTLRLTSFLTSIFFLLCLLTARAQTLTSSANIGSPAGGTDSFSSDVYTLTGLGSGINVYMGWNGTDNLHFVYKPVTGDVEIVARVVSFSCPGQGQVGLTMRTGTGTGDQIGANFLISNVIQNGVTTPFLVDWSRGPALDGYPYYDTIGKGQSYHPGLTLPFWLKLVRIGNNFGSYWSQDGRDWVLISDNSGGAFFPTTSYNVGLFVSSGSDTVSATATFDNVSVDVPHLKYKTSWIGSTSAGIAAMSPSNQIYALWVKPDGTCYTNSNWDEAGQAGKIYKDGQVVHPFFNDDGMKGANEGSVTGNGSYIFYSTNIGTPKVYRADFTALNSTTTQLTFNSALPLGQVGGIAASGSRIFVSDTTHGVVRVVDATTLTEITSTVVPLLPIPFPHCGPIACDGTNFWITDTASTFPLSYFVTPITGASPAYTPAIRCYAPDGSDTGRFINDVAVPTALAYDNRNTPGTTTDDRLWVCDNGKLAQNVRYYTNLTGPGNPVFAGTFGQTGGLWSGSNPGKIVDPAAGGDQRFYGPVGVGVDSDLNVYVACNGGSFFATDLRKFNSAGTLQWRINGLVFVQEGDFDPDPTKDGQEIYLPEKHITMNYANTAPGSEWSYTGYTRDLSKNATEERNPASTVGNNKTSGVKLARLGAGNKLYMYTSQQGDVGHSWLYYLNGETATAYGTNVVDAPGPNNHQIWIDQNVNGSIDAGETTSAPGPIPGGGFQSFDVDSGGDIWMNMMGNLAYGGPGSIRRVIYQGTRTLSNGAIVPNYNLSLGNPAGYVDYLPPAPLVSVANISYDKASDALYALGQKPDGTWLLTRTNGWTANPENQFNPVASWVVKVPTSGDVTMLYPSPALLRYHGMDIAGGKVFIAEEFGPVHVYDAAAGNLELTLNPGPEISARMGWVDMSMGLNAYKRSTGEYLVLIDNTGFHTADILYRWTPAADPAVMAAPTVLTASAAGRKVVLNWTGPTGMATSYKLYRSTTSGAETLYQSGITTPTFTDLNVNPGTTYYYKVTAVNSVGESAQSNEASAIPLSTQVEFVKTDTTTQGTWYTGTTSPNYIYGSQGYEVCNDGTSHYPTYATVTAPGTTVETWIDPTTHLPVDPTTDVRALQKSPPNNNRFMAYRRSTGSQIWSYQIDFATSEIGKWHQVAIYVLDWDSARTTSHQVKVYDASNNLLDTRRLWNFSKGKYLVWNINGSVRIEISEVGPQDMAIISGIFFDPVKVPTPGIAWWKMDDTSGTTAADSSGLGNNATTSGTSWNANGKVNRCVSIPGGSAKITLPSFPVGYLPPPITVSTWFKTSSTTGAVIVSSANALSSPTVFNPILYVGSDGKLRGSFYTGTTTSSTLLSSSTTVNDGTSWHHAALVSDGGTQTLYLDGAVVDSHAATLSTTSMPYAYLGYGTTTGYPSVSTPTNTFNGYLDDVRIDNRALTPGQIYQLANP